jgi:uncharacterized protein (AIM24 family)
MDTIRPRSIGYEITGDDIQRVEVEPNPGEGVRAEAGTVIYMNEGLRMQTDTGGVAAFDAGIDYDIEFAGGFKNALFGGEGMFLATLTGILGDLISGN